MLLVTLLQRPAASVVQDVGFQHIMNYVEPRFQIPYLKTYMNRMLPSLYLKVKDQSCHALLLWSGLPLLQTTGQVVRMQSTLVLPFMPVQMNGSFSTLF